MNSYEKGYSLFAVTFAIILLTCLLLFSPLRELSLLLPLSFAGLLINIGLVFVVLRDIFSRNFENPGNRYMWIALVFLFWPSILYYLPKYGFQPRNQ